MGGKRSRRGRDEVIGVKMRLFESVRLGLFVADGALALGFIEGDLALTAWLGDRQGG